MSKCTKVDSSRLMTIGLAMLAAANLGHWYIQRHSGWPENIADAAGGLLMGIAIATMLLAIVSKTRKR